MKKMVMEVKVCSNCKDWERDPTPYNGIYFGVCKADGRIKYEFHKCDFCEEEPIY